MPEVAQHVEYVMKIGTFAQGFAWNSVLQYDAEFRRLQKEKKRSWNVDDTYLMQLHLRSRQPQAERPATSATKIQSKTTSSRSKFDPCREIRYVRNLMEGMVVISTIAGTHMCACRVLRKSIMTSHIRPINKRDNRHVAFSVGHSKKDQHLGKRTGER